MARCDHAAMLDVTRVYHGHRPVPTARSTAASMRACSAERATTGGAGPGAALDGMQTARSRPGEAERGLGRSSLNTTDYVTVRNMSNELYGYNGMIHAKYNRDW